MREQVMVWLLAIVSLGVVSQPSGATPPRDGDVKGVKRLRPIPRHVLPGADGYQVWIAHSPNGKSILVCSPYNGHVFVYETLTWKLRAKWNFRPRKMGPPYPVFASDSWHLRAFDPVRKRPTNQVAIVDAPERWKTPSWVDPKTIRFAMDADRIAGKDFLGRLTVWSGQSVVFRVPTKFVPKKFALSPNGKFLVTVDQDGSCLLWDVDSERVLHTLGGKIQPFAVLRFACDSRAVAIECGENRVRLYSVKSGKRKSELATPKLRWGGNLFNLLFSPGGRYVIGLVAVRRPGSGISRPVRYFVWDRSGRVLGYFEAGTEVGGAHPFQHASFTRDGKHLIIGGYERVQVYSTDFLDKAAKSR